MTKRMVIGVELHERRKLAMANFLNAIATRRKRTTRFQVGHVRRQAVEVGLERKPRQRAAREDPRLALDVDHLVAEQIGGEVA